MGSLRYFRTLHLLMLQEKAGACSCGGDRSFLRPIPPQGFPQGASPGGTHHFFAESMWCLSGIVAGSAFAVIDVWGVGLAVVVVAALGFVVLAAALLACPPLLVRLLLKMAR